MHICKPGIFGYTETGEDVCEILKQFLTRVIKYNPLLVILFGSRVEGDWKPWSDIDVAVVFEKIEDKFKLLIELRKGIPYLELRLYTSNEFLKGIEYCDIGILDAISNGYVLYCCEDFLKKVKQVFKYYKDFYGLEKVEDGWIAKKWWNLPWNRK